MNEFPVIIRRLSLNGVDLVRVQPFKLVKILEWRIHFEFFSWGKLAHDSFLCSFLYKTYKELLKKIDVVLAHAAAIIVQGNI